MPASFYACLHLQLKSSMSQASPWAGCWGWEDEEAIIQAAKCPGVFREGPATRAMPKEQMRCLRKADEATPTLSVAPGKASRRRLSSKQKWGEEEGVSGLKQHVCTLPAGDLHDTEENEQ